MSRPKDHLPAPPDLPAFRVEEESAPELPEERHKGTGLVRHDARFDPYSLDPDAVKVVQRLERSGFQAYLVGGCVRDLLLAAARGAGEDGSSPWYSGRRTSTSPRAHAPRTSAVCSATAGSSGEGSAWPTFSSAGEKSSRSPRSGAIPR